MYRKKSEFHFILIISIKKQKNHHYSLFKKQKSNLINMLK